MDRPSVYAKSAREGIVSTILTSVLLSATALMSVTWSQSAQSSDDATMRHLGQYLMSVGQKQYDGGSYDQAVMTLQMADKRKDYLDPVEQRKLQSLLEKARAAERRRVLAVRQAAEDSRRKGDVAAARAHLESIKNSQVLTEKERLEIADALRVMGPGTPANTVGATGSLPAAPTSKPPEVQAGTGMAPGQGLTSSIATQYYEALKAYRADDLNAAQAGFTKVLQNESLSAPLVSAVRGYLAEIEAKQGQGQPPMMGSGLAGIVPAVGVTALANTPAAASQTDSNAPADANKPATPAQPAQSEVDRIAELYTRSWELYSQGELAAARQGFVEVAKSGLFKGAEGRRPEDYIATIDRLLAAQAAQPAAAPVAATPAPASTPVIPAPTPVAVTPSPAPTTVTPVTPASVPEPNVTVLAAATPAPEQGGSIEAINRKRSIIRSYTEAAVNDAVAQAQKLIAQGQFDAAADRVADAQRKVNEAQFYLGEELYKQYTQRLSQTADRIQEARSAREKELAEQKHQEAAKAQSELRTQAEMDRQNRIKELMAAREGLLEAAAVSSVRRPA